MALVYRHIREDNGEIFYIGISKNNLKRPYSTAKRNRIWKTIVQETKYKVEIIYSGISYEKACEIEQQLIKEHGRIIYGEGTLANIMEGGEENVWNNSVRTKLLRLYKKLGYNPATDKPKRRVYILPPPKINTIYDVEVIYEIINPWSFEELANMRKKRKEELKAKRIERKLQQRKYHTPKEISPRPLPTPQERKARIYNMVKTKQGAQ